MLLRFGRIYPLHFAILMGFVVLIFVKYALNQTTTDDGQNIFSDPSYSVQTFITNVFLLHSFGINSSYSWNIPSWSIATEMWMYLLFGFLAVRFGKFLNPILTGLAVMSLLIILNFSSLGMNTANNFGMFRCVAGFAIGALLFDFWSRGTWPPNQLSTLLELVCFGCAIFFVHMANNAHFAIIAPLVFAPVVFIFANQQGQLSKLLQARCFLILGTLSYSIYMDHALLIEIVKTINEFYVYGFHDSTLNNLPAVAQVNHSMGSNMVQSLGWLGFMIFLLISVSYFTYKFIENPSRLWFRNYSNLKN